MLDCSMLQVFYSFFKSATVRSCDTQFVEQNFAPASNVNTVLSFINLEGD